MLDASGGLGEPLNVTPSNLITNYLRETHRNTYRSSFLVGAAQMSWMPRESSTTMQTQLACK